MGVSERKLRQQEDLRRQILEYSREIVHEEGWAALSIRKIADAIEYSVPVIYKHFENKEAITAYFVQEGFQLLYEEMQQRIQPGSSIEERFEQLADAYYHFAKNYPKNYEVMFGVGIPNCETAKSIESVKKLSMLFRDMIQELISKSGKTDQDSCLKYRTLWSVLHGVVAFELLSLSGQDQVCSSLALTDVIQSYVKSILV